MKSLIFAVAVLACSPAFADWICGEATHDGSSEPPTFYDNANNFVGTIVGATEQAEVFFNSYQPCDRQCADGYKPFPTSRFFIVNYAKCDNQPH